MKKILFAIAALSVATSAYASDARFKALNRSRTVDHDFVELFEQPSRIWTLKDQALLDNDGTNNQGGFILSSETAKYGVYFGHQSELLQALSPVITGATGLNLNAEYTKFDNPLNVFYGREMGGLKYGFNFYYTNSKRETTTVTPTAKNAMGLAAGIEAEGWDVNLVLGLGAEIKDNTTPTATSDKLTGTTNLKLQGEYALAEDLLSYAVITMGGLKGTTGVVTDAEITATAYELGIERIFKKEAARFFYGASLLMEKADVKATGTTTTVKDNQLVPLYFGLEADAASWLVFRGSIKQNVLIGTEKAGTTTDSLVGTPTMVAGVGIKLGNFMLDGNAQLAGGTINATNLVTQTALTYTF